MSKPFYITTAIDYPNGKPHIGHAYEKVAADVLARFYRERGLDTFFLTGTDEHGAKIAQYATEAGKTEQEYVDEYSAYFSFAWDVLNVVPDRFIRTTDADHVKTVEELVTKIKDHGYLYEADYEGLYCTGHEAFITDKDLVNGLCPEHQKAPEQIQEKNWFFKITEFTQRIKEKIISNEFKVWPDSARNEILSWLDQGFKDIAVTRPNVKWGIQTPWDKEQTIYVWVDALINYVSGVGYVSNQNQFNKFWPANWHVVGRDISKFHCIIWPALLLAAGIEIPKGVVVHGYLTLNNQKISKSLGNIVDPQTWVAKYGADAVRYFLLREVPFGQDGDVSEEKLRARYEGDLANGLGNLVSRVTTLVEKYIDAPLTGHRDVIYKNLVETEGKTIDILIEDFKFHEALAKVWEQVAQANKLVDEKKLWELAKADVKEFTEISEHLLAKIRFVAEKLLPFIPDSAGKILDAVGKDKIAKVEPLFPRIV